MIRAKAAEPLISALVILLIALVLAIAARTAGRTSTPPSAEKNGGSPAAAVRR